MRYLISSIVLALFVASGVALADEATALTDYEKFPVVAKTDFQHYLNQDQQKTVDEMYPVDPALVVGCPTKPETELCTDLLPKN